MSKHGKIVLTRPLTDEEKEWLLTRAGGQDTIDANERAFGGLSEEQREALRSEADADSEEEQRRQAEFNAGDEDGFSQELLAQVMPLSVAELKAWLKKNGIEQDGTVEDLQLRMLEALEAAQADK